jgi:hypothetical protein
VIAFAFQLLLVLASPAIAVAAYAAFSTAAPPSDAGE